MVMQFSNVNIQNKILSRFILCIETCHQIHIFIGTNTVQLMSNSRDGYNVYMTFYNIRIDSYL